MEELLLALDDIFSDLISFLPNSPFVAYLTVSENPDIVNGIKWLNLFVDMPSIIIISELWLTAIAGWFIISVAIRWAKAVQ